MANYYTDYSFRLMVTDEQHQWIESKNRQEDDPDYPRFNYEVQNTGRDDQNAWFYSFGDDSSYDGLDDLALMISEFLEHFKDDSVIVIEFASTCSRPILDSFGGGLFIVTKDEVHSWSTGDEYMRWMKAREEVDSE